MINPNADLVGLISVRIPTIHRKRRKLWEKGLGMKGKLC